MAATKTAENVKNTTQEAKEIKAKSSIEDAGKVDASEVATEEIQPALESVVDNAEEVAPGADEANAEADAQGDATETAPEVEEPETPQDDPMEQVEEVVEQVEEAVDEEQIEEAVSTDEEESEGATVPVPKTIPVKAAPKAAPKAAAKASVSSPVKVVQCIINEHGVACCPTCSKPLGSPKSASPKGPSPKAKCQHCPKQLTVKTLEKNGGFCAKCLVAIQQAQIKAQKASLDVKQACPSCTKMYSPKTLTKHKGLCPKCDALRAVNATPTSPAPARAAPKTPTAAPKMVLKPTGVKLGTPKLAPQPTMATPKLMTTAIPKLGAVSPPTGKILPKLAAIPKSPLVPQAKSPGKMPMPALSFKATPKFGPRVPVQASA